MSQFDENIFGRKKFSDLLKQIHDNQEEKAAQIKGLISELKPLIADIGDATLIVPLIKEYMELGIKNDEVLVKMATIVQRALHKTGNSDDSILLTDEERAQLMAEIKKIEPPKDNG